MKFPTSILLTPILAQSAPQETASPSGTAPPQESTAPSDLPTCADEISVFRGWNLTSFSLSSTSSRTAPVFGARKAASTLSFKVENPILDYAVECEAEAETSLGAIPDSGNGTSGAAGEFDGQYEFQCDAPEDAVQRGDVVFSFDEDSGRVHLKQRWVCFDDPQYPTIYTGTGEGTADLECETGDEQINENWKLGSGDEYASLQKVCDETVVPLKVTGMDAIA